MSAQIIGRGLALDDVLLVPQRSSLTSRADVDLTTTLAPGLTLAIPIVSANTPWCTESAMAIGMAQNGGLGIIHRMCTIDHEAAEVRAVKMAAIGSTGRPSTDARGRLLVGAAVGVRGDWRARARELVASGVDLLLVDIAHGHSAHAIATVETLRAEYPSIVIATGNVATREGVRDLARAGAQIVKIGIGPGSVCTTRTVAGAGVPQLTAILECAEEALHHDARVIADGGIRSSGDIVKALAAGASAVMLGNLLAGTEESSAVLVEDGGQKFKITTGFVTIGAKLMVERAYGRPVTREAFEQYVAEGIEATFPYRGPLAAVLRELCGGARSGFSYAGSSSLRQLWERAQFIEVTNAGRAEAEPFAQRGSRQVQPDYQKLLVD